MSKPTAIDVIEFLEGYGISNDIISVGWIDKRIDNLIIPWIENHTRLNFSKESEYIEYLSGNGLDILTLSRKPINNLISLEYVITEGTLFNLITLVELNKQDGILIAKANPLEGQFNHVFQKGNKNIKVIYTAGYNDFIDIENNKIIEDIREAIIYLTAKQVLIQVGSRTGGGSLGVQSHSRNYGARGKYTDFINHIDMMAYEILKNYFTGVVGT